jgi:hypothetical protein
LGAEALIGAPRMIESFDPFETVFPHAQLKLCLQCALCTARPNVCNSAPIVQPSPSINEIHMHYAAALAIPVFD